MSSKINEIVKQHGLKVGDEMKNIHGETIPGSCILSDSMIIHREEDHYRLIMENPITGEQHQQFIRAEALAALKNYAG